MMAAQRNRRSIRRQAAQLTERRRGQIGRLASGSLIRRSACSAITKATSRSRKCRRTFIASMQDRRDDGGRSEMNRPNGLVFSPDESKLYVVEAGSHAARDSTPMTS